MDSSKFAKSVMALPEEVLYYIFDCAPLETKLSLKEVCKMYNKTIQTLSALRAIAEAIAELYCHLVNKNDGFISFHNNNGTVETIFVDPVMEQVADMVEMTIKQPGFIAANSFTPNGPIVPSLGKDDIMVKEIFDKLETRINVGYTKTDDMTYTMTPNIAVNLLLEITVFDGEKVSEFMFEVWGSRQ